MSLKLTVESNRVKFFKLNFYFCIFYSKILNTKNNRDPYTGTFPLSLYLIDRTMLICRRSNTNSRDFGADGLETHTTVTVDDHDQPRSAKWRVVCISIVGFLCSFDRRSCHCFQKIDRSFVWFYISNIFMYKYWRFCVIL